LAQRKRARKAAKSRVKKRPAPKAKPKPKPKPKPKRRALTPAEKGRQTRRRNERARERARELRSLAARKGAATRRENLARAAIKAALGKAEAVTRRALEAAAERHAKELRKVTRERNAAVRLAEAKVILAHARAKILGEDAHAADPAAFEAMRAIVERKDRRFRKWMRLAEDLGLDEDDARDEWFSPEVIV
jgi:hypothetical protein